MASRRVLITGGVRSGKSRYAEGLLADEPRVTYVAPGPVPDPVADPEWAARVAQHRDRRPLHWTTMETVEVADAVRGSDGAVLLDCLGTWVTAVLDGAEAWDRSPVEWRGDFDVRVADLVRAWADHRGTAVAVSNEVGWGLVSEHNSGRIFTDLLGTVNQQLAAVCDEVFLVVAGRALRL
jgi:adenosylcobinamide kinase/adenosylcobinamide-phosphate guanylyltransferase